MRSRVRILMFAVLVVTGTAIAHGAPAGAAGRGGAPGGTFIASCVLGPLHSTRTFTAVAHAPDSVAPGAAFSVETSVDYPVAVGLTAGIAYFDVIGATPVQPHIFAAPGDPAIAGPLALTANGTPGSSVDVLLHSFGAGLLQDGASESEVCTPVHRLVVARVGIGVPRVSVGDAAVVEGSSRTRVLEFAVSLSRPSTTPVTVAFATEDGTATAGVDYVAQSGTATFQPGAVTVGATIKVRVMGDRVVEPKENFRVRLRDPVGAVLGRPIGTGRIIDDDPEPGVRVSVGDGSVVEGAHGEPSSRFTISLSAPVTQRVTFHFSTSDGTAVVGKDYGALSVDWFIEAGAMSATLPVEVLSNGVADGNRTFRVHLTGVTGAAVGRANGVGTIIDDD
jgi:hypothetical protein